VEKSWRLFIETEDLGGFISLLTSGYMKKKISEMAAKRKTEKENETSIQI
jgi:methylmalonyl-CoA mutase N-terminal domain/subunit